MGAADDERANTLYLIAPDTEFKRLAPVLGGLLGDLREQIHAWDIEGRRLTKPLLFVIDEAAQLELQWLPEEVSTIAGLGGVFVTCWQSKAQIDHRYGTLADAVLDGHRTKVVFTGCDDPATLTWLTKVTGSEHIARRGWSADTAGGRRTDSEHLQREDLVSAHVVRQMWPGEAVLLHGTLPPVHLRAIRWWQDKTLRHLVPTDANGRPVAPDIDTCPRGKEAPVPGETGLDRATLDESATHLPGSHPATTTGSTSPASTGPDAAVSSDATYVPVPGASVGHPGSVPRRVTMKATRADQPQLRLPNLDTADAAPDTPNDAAARCVSCGRWVAAGDGILLPYSLAITVSCTSCHAATCA